MDEQLKQSALDFHEFPVPGKIQVSPTKPLATQRDLALAYSPGVAAPCLEIEKDPLAAYKYTARGNLVAVISNGTAVLGLGNIGARAARNPGVDNPGAGEAHPDRASERDRNAYPETGVTDQSGR